MIQQGELESGLRSAGQQCGVPEHTLESLILYIVHHIEPGGFLVAFLANDLMEAIGRADQQNAYAIKEIATFVYSYAPNTCHGSYEKIKSYLSQRSA